MYPKGERQIREGLAAKDDPMAEELEGHQGRKDRPGTCSIGSGG